MDCLKATAIAVLLFCLLDHSEAGRNCTVAKTCKDCLNFNESTCYWCDSSNECKKKDSIIITDCKSIDWRYYGNCTVPGYVWVIVIPVLAIVFLFSLLCCFYCFCCRCKTSSRSMEREETRFHRKRMELKAKHDERKAERNIKNDEIRKKYGLYKEDGGSSSNKYENFENDPEA